MRYNDGPHFSVDWTNAATLQDAIYKGPVKIGVSADQLETVVGSNSGWFDMQCAHRSLRVRRRLLFRLVFEPALAI